MSGDLHALPLPLPADWARIGVRCLEELHGGHQSRVFRANRAGQSLVVKLTDGRLADDAHTRRVEIVAELARFNSAVVSPVPLDSGLVASIGGWLVVAYPEVVGAAPDIRLERDVRTMAETLAALHESLRLVGDHDLPMVAALRGKKSDAHRAGSIQLLHGDFSSANVRFVNGNSKVFDFDDCGYGSIEFEIGNTLYMVLFDSAMDDDESRFDRFRSWFVDSYRSATELSFSDADIERGITGRIDALGRWIDDPATAPIGIRTASPAWLQKLHAFVSSH